MIRAEQIPDEVVEAFRKAWMDGSLSARAALSAALNAWPGAKTGPNIYHCMDAILHLPLLNKEGDA